MNTMALRNSTANLNLITEPAVKRKAWMRATDVVGKVFSVASVTTLLGGLITGFVLSSPLGFLIGAGSVLGAAILGGTGWLIGHIDNNADLKVRNDNLKKIENHVHRTRSDLEDEFILEVQKKHPTHIDRPDVAAMDLAILCMMSDKKLSRLSLGVQAAVHEVQRDISAYRYHNTGISWPAGFNQQAFHDNNNFSNAACRVKLYKRERNHLQSDLPKSLRLQRFANQKNTNHHGAAFAGGVLTTQMDVNDWVKALGFIIVGGVLTAGLFSLHKNFIEARPEVDIKVPDVKLKSAQTQIQAARAFLKKPALRF